MEDKLTLKDFTKIIKNINETIKENKNYLNKIDSFIGDGDHGTTISRGFNKSVEKLKEKETKNISELLNLSGFTLVATMGGAAGPLFGSVLQGMAKAAEGKDNINLGDLYKMFLSALEKVQKVGKANPGDKTMIDALYPAVESLKESIKEKLTIKNALRKASLAAEKGAESTKDMVAKKGKSRYHGERSLGYQDAGATTLTLIIKVMYEAI